MVAGARLGDKTCAIAVTGARLGDRGCALVVTAIGVAP